MITVIILSLAILGLVILYRIAGKHDYFSLHLKCDCGYKKGILSCPYCKNNIKWNKRNDLR